MPATHRAERGRHPDRRRHDRGGRPARARGAGRCDRDRCAERPADASGLINAHTHGHGNLGKGMGDRWTLELLLAAGPLDHRRPHARGQVSQHLCRRDRDAAEGLHRLLRPHRRVSAADASRGSTPAGAPIADAGMRAVLAPMVAEFSFYEAIPGLLDALPPALQKEVERLPARARRRDARTRCASRCRAGRSTATQVRPGGGADHSASLLRRLHARVRARWRANSTSGCTATCRNPRCR